MMREMEFIIDDEPAKGIYLTPSQQKAIDYLDSLPDGQMVRGTHRLTELVGIGPKTMAYDRAIFQPYKYSVSKGVAVLWGNPRTIAAWKKKQESK